MKTKAKNLVVMVLAAVIFLTMLPMVCPQKAMADTNTLTAVRALSEDGDSTEIQPGDEEEPVSEEPAKSEFEEKAVISSISKKEYTGKAIKPEPVVKIGKKTLKKDKDYKVSYKNNKNVGTATVVVEGTGKYSGTITKTFKINPKGTTIKATVSLRKSAIINWNRQAKKMSKKRVTGYQIQLATNKKFTKNVKKVKVEGYQKAAQMVKKLKGGKKYFVRIRTYSTVDKKTYYSKWSPVKTVNTLA